MKHTTRRLIGYLKSVGTGFRPGRVGRRQAAGYVKYTGRKVMLKRAQRGY